MNTNGKKPCKTSHQFSYSNAFKHNDAVKTNRNKESANSFHICKLLPELFSDNSATHLDSNNNSLKHKSNVKPQSKFQSQFVFNPESLNYVPSPNQLMLFKNYFANSAPMVIGNQQLQQPVVDDLAKTISNYASQKNASESSSTPFSASTSILKMQRMFDEMASIDSQNWVCKSLFFELVNIWKVVFGCL